MKIGLSSYSLFRAIQAGQMTILDAIDWIAQHEGEHIEIVPLGFSLEDDDGLADAIRIRAKDAGIDISNYAVGGNIIQDSREAYENEIKQLKRQVEHAASLGVKLMRHDIASRPVEHTSIDVFYQDLPLIVEACGEVADYAAKFGITTSIENHGFHVQASERVQLIVNLVNRDNFRTTLDVGNFVCVDEDSVSAVKNNISIASMVHLKDFYMRPAYKYPGEGWFTSTHGNYRRGAIVGQGDLDMWEIIKVVKQSGYNGYVSIEFEGMEDCLQGSRIGMENARRIFSNC